MNALERWVRSTFFTRLSLWMILLSSVLIGVETVDSMMARYGNVLRFMDRIILIWFVIEIGCRMAAYGWRVKFFFKSAWNTFDFLIVVACLLPTISPAVAIFRLFRVLRVLRLFSSLPDLQILVSTILKTLPSMSYVGMLLFLVMYVYGVLGTHLFRATDPAHFGNLGLSLLSLFKIITLEGWAAIFHPQFENYGWIAACYFISFIFIGTMVLLNLLIGVVIRSMEQVQSEHAKSVLNGHLSDDVILNDIVRSADALQEKIQNYLVKFKRDI